MPKESKTTHHEEHLLETVPQVLPGSQAEGHLLFSGASQMAGESKEVRVRDIKDPSKHLLAQHVGHGGRRGPESS